MAPPEFKVGPVSVVFAGRVSPPLVSVIVVAAGKADVAKLTLAPSGAAAAASSASRSEQALSVELVVVEPCGLQFAAVPASSALVFTTNNCPVTTANATGVDVVALASVPSLS